MRLLDRSRFIHCLSCISLGIFPSIRLNDKHKSCSDLLRLPRSEGNVPVILFPDRCKTSNRGMDHKHSGIPPVIDRLL